MDLNDLMACSMRRSMRVQALAILDSDPHSMITRLMLDNMTKKDPKAPGELTAPCRSALHEPTFVIACLPCCAHAVLASGASARRHVLESRPRL